MDTEKEMLMDNEKKRLKKMRREDLRKAVILVLLIIVLFGKIFGFTVMCGNFMSPSIKNGDVLFYYRLQSQYENGDVVVYEVNHITYVGRIAALPKETVEITQEGQLVVNGYTQADFNSENAYEQGAKADAAPWKLLKDEYFILVDDKTSVEDSRTYGPISKKNIRGVVITFLRRRKI